MSRSVQWRRTQPEAVGGRAEEALQKTLYIVHQTGPTGFVLKEEGRERKFKVFLGDVHQCTCSVYRKERELCVHILWVLLKKFRVSRENPLMFQLGLVQREINEILHGNQTTQQQNSEQEATCITSQTNQLNSVVRRAITSEDVCPICQEEFSARPLAITYCKFGCGQNVHVKCMKIWSEHQRSDRREESELHCPMCRGKFVSLKELCSSDMCVYNPHSGPETSTSHCVRAPHKKRTKPVDRVSYTISRLRAYPVTGDGVMVERGASCEMCGEVYTRGDWLRKLPCKHKFHRECIDQWLRAGHMVCPVDGSSVSRPRAKEEEQQERSEEKGRGRVDGNALTLSGLRIGLSLLPKSTPSSGDRSIRSVRGIEKCDRGNKQLPTPTHISRDTSHDTTPPSIPPLSSANFHLPPLPPLLSAKSHLHLLQQKRADSVTSRKPLPSSLKKSLSLSGSRAVPNRSVEAAESGLLVSRLKLCPLSSSMES